MIGGGTVVALFGAGLHGLFVVVVVGDDVVVVVGLPVVPGTVFWIACRLGTAKPAIASMPWTKRRLSGVILFFFSELSM